MIQATAAKADPDSVIFLCSAALAAAATKAFAQCIGAHYTYNFSGRLFLSGMLIYNSGMIFSAWLIYLIPIKKGPDFSSPFTKFKHAFG